MASVVVKLQGEHDGEACVLSASPNGVEILSLAKDVHEQK